MWVGFLGVSGLSASFGGCEVTAGVVKEKKKVWLGNASPGSGNDIRSSICYVLNCY